MPELTPEQSTEARRRSEGGFTLIELLVVITILGILSAIVVFSVAGINDRGQGAACGIDIRTLRTAEEANYARFGGYATEAQLVTNGFLSNQSPWHDVLTVVAPAPPTPGSYTVGLQPFATGTNPCPAP